MTLWAKVFCVIVLILSILFAGFTLALFAKKEDWRGRYNAEHKVWADEKARLTGERNNLTEEVRKVNISLTQNQGELTRVQTQLIKKTAEATQLIGQIAAKDTQISTLTANLTGLTKTAAKWEKRIADQDVELKKRDAEIARVRGDLSTAHANIQNQAKEMAELKVERDQLKVDLANAREILEARDRTIAYLVTHNFITQEQLDVAKGIITVPRIRGKVLVVDHKGKMVMLNVGVRDGVKKGMKFTVFRGPNYVADIAVFDLQKDDLSAARIVLPVKGRLIEIGDDVATRIGY